MSKLEESEIKYRRLFESAHDGILILDSENRTDYGSKSFFRKHYLVIQKMNF